MDIEDEKKKFPKMALAHNVMEAFVQETFAILNMFPDTFKGSAYCSFCRIALREKKNLCPVNEAKTEGFIFCEDSVCEKICEHVNESFAHFQKKTKGISFHLRKEKDLWATTGFLCIVKQTVGMSAGRPYLHICMQCTKSDECGTKRTKAVSISELKETNMSFGSFEELDD
jgi:hypothetical protein